MAKSFDLAGPPGYDPPPRGEFMIVARGRLKRLWARLRRNLAAPLRPAGLGPKTRDALTWHAIVVLLLALAPATLARAAEDPALPSWSNLSDQQARILAPLRADWSQLPEYQRRRLLGVADLYPTLSPEKQQRFSSRLLQWSRLSLEQRNAARDLPRKIQMLPPPQRVAIEQRWKDWKSAEDSQRSQPQ